MSEKLDVKKALETILGHELAEDEVETIQLIQPVASYTRSDSPGEGFVTKKSLLTNLKRCEPALLLDVNGIATTGKDGKSIFRLTNFICLDGVTFERPINFVATPLSSKPCFLTALISLVNNGADVEIHVSSWNANGAAVPNISFDWRCQVELVNIIF